LADASIYLDEDVHVFLAEALRLRGYTALTTEQAGRRGTSDAGQLRFAAEQRHVLLTYNVGDFARLHYELLARDEHHAGIILAKQSEGSRNLRPLLSLLSQVSAEKLQDQLVYLSSWAR
jgi:hypothetical protein